MPALGGLTDEQIAEVLTFVRTAYGGMAGEVSADEVTKLRAANLNRESPWNAGELGK